MSQGKLDAPVGPDATADGSGVPGIAEADQARLFERFYRAPNAAPQGSGLGLAIADELARRMGGRVEVVSKPGDTRFALVLPLASS